MEIKNTSQAQDMAVTVTEREAERMGIVMNPGILTREEEKLLFGKAGETDDGSR